MVEQSELVTRRDLDGIIAEHVGKLAFSLGADYDPRPLFEEFSADVDEDWNQNIAIGLVRAAMLAYLPESQVRSTLEREKKINEVVWLENQKTSTQGFIAFSEKFTVVAFRGTETHGLSSTLRDVKTDLRFGQKTTSLGKVHTGFSESLDSVWSQLDGHIDALKKVPVWVTGHSLGGALATLATARFSLECGVSIGGLYTIGQPRVGDDDFAKRARESIGKSRIFRIYKSMDPVPKVPWSWKSLIPNSYEPWQHVSGSRRCFISRNGEMKVQSRKFRRWVDILISFIGMSLVVWNSRGRDIGVLASDHAATKYLQAVHDAGALAWNRDNVPTEHATIAKWFARKLGLGSQKDNNNSIID